ncbi:MAG: restriction endonuclease PLD domain-containing protein, partial [bacterium]
RDEDSELVDRLEKLKNEEKLLIYTCPRKTVHSKMYIIQSGEEVELITGSANLTYTGWGNQTNHLAIFKANPGSKFHEKFLEDYREQKEKYGELFLADLTEKIESSSEDREEVINYWLQGKDTPRNEFQELNIKATEQLESISDPSEAESDVVLSLRGFEEDTRETIQQSFKEFGGSFGTDSAQISPGNYSRYLKKEFGVPKMWIDGQGVNFIPPGGRLQRLTEKSGEGDLSADLANLEAYFESVDNFGETNRPASVKAHMMEALLYFFWAPFINQQALFERSRDIDNLDKNLPFLYIYGESNSGKGTFARFALSLISNNTVSTPIDADEVTTKNIRNIRMSNSCFPLVVDDINKNKINRLEPLKNYWTGWEEKTNYPSLIFISNDRKPDEWFRNRAKILHFDVMFHSSKEGEAEVNRIIDYNNRIFSRVGRRFNEKFKKGHLQLEDDLLAPLRKIMVELYDEAEREIPDYFPHKPAERAHDMGRIKWQRLRRHTDFTTTMKEGELRLEFPGDMEHWEVAEYRRHLPPFVRADQEGTRVIVKNPHRFQNWLKKPTNNKGFVEKLKSLFTSP